MLVLGRRHLEHVLREHVEHYYLGRPHRGLDLRVPCAERRDPAAFASGERVRRQDVFGGLIHEYDLAA